MLFRKLFQSSAPVAPVPASAIPEPASAVAAAATVAAEAETELAKVQVSAAATARELSTLKESFTALQSQDAAKAEQINVLSAEIAGLKGQIAEITAARDAAQALANKTREDLTQEIKQKEMALLAASQGVPITEVPPETQTSPENQKDAPLAIDYSKADPLTLIAIGRSRLANKPI